MLQVDQFFLALALLVSAAAAFDNAGLLVDFVQTVSAATHACVDTASHQDQPAARLWSDTSKTLTDIYTQAVQEARKGKTTETHDQAMPLDFSIDRTYA